MIDRVLPNKLPHAKNHAEFLAWLTLHDFSDFLDYVLASKAEVQELDANCAGISEELGKAIVEGNYWKALA